MRAVKTLTASHGTSFTLMFSIPIQVGPDFLYQLQSLLVRNRGQHAVHVLQVHTTGFPVHRSAINAVSGLINLLGGSISVFFSVNCR